MTGDHISRVSYHCLLGKLFPYRRNTKQKGKAIISAYSSLRIVHMHVRDIKDSITCTLIHIVYHVTFVQSY